MENLQLLIETSERAKSNSHRIDNLEKDTRTIYELVKSVERIAINTENIQKELALQGAKIEALEERPGKQWGDIRKVIITSITTTIVGAIVGAVMALILK